MPTRRCLHQQKRYKPLHPYSEMVASYNKKCTLCKANPIQQNKCRPFFPPSICICSATHALFRRRRQARVLHRRDLVTTTQLLKSARAEFRSAGDASGTSEVDEALIKIKADIVVQAIATAREVSTQPGGEGGGGVTTKYVLYQVGLSLNLPCVFGSHHSSRLSQS